MTKTILAAAAFAAMTCVASAPASADRIDNRQANQMQRIEQGWQSGRLTRAEYNQLIDQQRHIARLERRLKRDGYLSPAERTRLRVMQANASRRIFWEKHDGQNRGAAKRGWGYGRGQGWGRNRDYGSGYGRHTGPARRWYQWN